MTDCSLVSRELSMLLGLTDEEVSSYESFVEYAVNCVCPLIKEGENENDVRIVHLCAVRAYYQIVMTQDEGISSFSASGVSFKVDASAPSRARELLDEASAACSSLLKSSDFVFRAV